MNFKDLQKSWQAQPVKASIDPHKLSQQKSKWQIYQRKLLISNIIISLICLALMIIITPIYISDKHKFGWPFTVSIGAVYLLMFLICAISWKSYAFKKENLEVSSIQFINYQIKKLNWQRFIITKYIWVHTVLIWLALVMFIWETTSLRTTTFRLTFLTVTTVYCLGITGWIMFKRSKKGLLKLNSMIADLENMKEKLLENENT